MNRDTIVPHVVRVTLFMSICRVTPSRVCELKSEGLESLTPELRNMAELRLENPDVSLKELGEMLDKPVGRSGANHRLKKLMEIAEQIREDRSKAGKE